MVLSAFSCGVFSAEPAGWNVMPENESELIQDSRWHQLSDTEKTAMLSILAGSSNGLQALELLAKDLKTYQKLSGLYDLLAIAVKNHQETLLFFLLSQGVKITDRAINSAYETHFITFLEFGLSPDYTLANGDTLLVNAVKGKKWGVAKLLLEAQADVMVKDAAGKTAFEYVTLSDINWYFNGSSSIFYKHLTFLQKLKSRCPSSQTIVEAIGMTLFVTVAAIAAHEGYTRFNA